MDTAHPVFYAEPLSNFDGRFFSSPITPHSER